MDNNLRKLIKKAGDLAANNKLGRRRLHHEYGYTIK
jgi:hypothetical protein